MEVSALNARPLICVLFLLGAHVQDVDSLILRPEPNRLQFFEYESLTFHCEGAHDSTGLKIVHQSKGELLTCKNTETSTWSCTLPNVFPEDSGPYWCESGDGKRSNIISITVSAGPVILESPISVEEREAVTLRCRHKTTSSNLSADFYKDGLLIRRSSTGNMSIPIVSKCDEGLYKCSISVVGESGESLMAVQESHQEIHTSSDLLFIIFRNVLPVVMMALLLLLLGWLHGEKLRGEPTGKQRHLVCSQIEMEIPK